jgi:hypothetical protein
VTLDEVIRELRKLNEPVPKPRRLPTDSEVEQAQAALGVTFHPDYRKYLLAASDVVFGTTEPCTLVGGGHTNFASVAADAWAMGVPRHLVPICEDNGDYFCMNGAGEVVFWSHDGTTDERWSDLATWIKRVWIDGG